MGPTGPDQLTLSLTGETETMATKSVYISNIQRFSVDDGPGIRSTVFLMGCNLHCLWCHNPECLAGHIQVEFQEERCVLCGRCQKVCPTQAHRFEGGRHLIDRRLCRGCQACQAICPARTLKTIGRPLSPEEVLAEVMKDAAYYRKSGGGMTVSGGEPMLHPRYLKSLLEAGRQAGIGSAVDTAGNVPFAWFQAVAPVTDIFLYDVKIFDSRQHQLATGVPNEQILANLRALAKLKARLIVRVPVIAELSRLDDLTKIAEFLAPLSVELTQLLPYHSYGLGKYGNLGLESRLTDHVPPSDAFMEEVLNIFKAKGVQATIN